MSAAVTELERVRSALLSLVNGDLGQSNLETTRPKAENADLPDETGQSLPSPAPQSWFEKTRPIHGARVLLVEDNSTNQLVAQEFLAKMGLVVDIAGHGREAIAMVALQQYDIILMDLQMPEMDGFEVTRRIRATGCRLPIIAMTAAVTEQDRQACTAAGMNAPFTKPISAQELSSVLLRWVPSKKVEPGLAVLPK
ncbi:hypothetical protein CCP3SC15_5870001 [Gammaproteobacteria bacterium]